MILYVFGANMERHCAPASFPSVACWYEQSNNLFQYAIFRIKIHCYSRACLFFFFTWRKIINFANKHEINIMQFSTSHLTRSCQNYPARSDFKLFKQYSPVAFRSGKIHGVEVYRHLATSYDQACLNLFGFTEPLELNTSLCKKYCEFVSRRYRCTGCSVRC